MMHDTQWLIESLLKINITTLSLLQGFHFSLKVLDIDLPKSDLELAKLMQELAEDERQHPTYNLGFFVGVLWLMADRAYIPTEPHSTQARLDAGGNFLV